MKDAKQKITGEYVYKLVTRKGYVAHSSTAAAGLKQCVALFNREHQPKHAISYDKAFRNTQKQGLHVEFVKCTWEVGSETLLPLVVIFSAADPETLPERAKGLFDEIQEQNASFQQGMTPQQLGHMAHEINHTVANKQLTILDVEAQGQAMLAEFKAWFALECDKATVEAHRVAGSDQYFKVLFMAIDELVWTADSIINDVNAFERAGSKEVSPMQLFEQGQD